jgi:hypothetical protein
VLKCSLKNHHTASDYLGCSPLGVLPCLPHVGLCHSRNPPPAAAWEQLDGARLPGQLSLSTWASTPGCRCSSGPATALVAFTGMAPRAMNITSCRSLRCLQDPRYAHAIAPSNTRPTARRPQCRSRAVYAPHNRSQLDLNGSCACHIIFVHPRPTPNAACDWPSLLLLRWELLACKS